MNNGDLINAVFELGGSITIWLHTRKIIQDRGHAGVSVWSVAFMILWGVWNLWYYPSLNQWLSFFAGCSICLANVVWLGFLIYYGKIHTNETLHNGELGKKG